jgi:triosephosphate isomerase
MKKLIIANWKMALGINESVTLARDIANLAFDCELVICPSHPYLFSVKEAISKGKAKLGAQDCANRNVSAFTGGVSAFQLKELGCEYAIVGHSERRIYAHETAQEIHDKIKNLLEAGITPILCLGEDIISYKAKETKEVISMQLDEIGFEIDWSKVIVAYEPIWAIGTGKVPTNDEIESVAKIIADRVNPMGIIYGGSVNAENIAQLSAINHIKGFLIGSASTKLEELIAILSA